ncbi:MAG TPA: PqqD family peptide modification chaperone [Magnetospirillum sp.]|nr:PqqD family peptide modification chaperone [Magnetospirillum sp.]
MISIENRIVINQDLLSTELDGETVMMDVESGQYYTLNAVGSRIWQELAAPTSVDVLCIRLEEEYDATPDVLREGVLRFLNQMLEKRLIRVEA